jgi:hypothetical protein
MPALANAAWSERPPTDVSSVGTPMVANGVSRSCCSASDPDGWSLGEYTK